MKKILIIIFVVLLFPTYCLAQEEESFALIDWGSNKVVILDFSGNVLFEKDFNGIGVCYFIFPSANGWLVKGCLTSGCWGEDWIIWQLQPDGTINNTLTGLGPGPFYTGIGSGNFVSGNVYTGVIDLYNETGAIINSINVWAEEDGLPYNYSRLGDTAGLVGGGFVVPPQGGWPSINQLYTPYLYYYDNNLNLINTIDISTVDMRLLNLTGLSDGGFAGTCAAHGTGYDVESLCWFNSEGGLVEVVDVINDLPFRDYMNVFIAGLSDGRVMLTVYGRDKVWIYDPPSSEDFFIASQTEVLDLSGAGVSAIGGIAGNILMLDTVCDGDLDCDDESFCNGVETCVEGNCQEGAYPCADPTPACEEENDLCIEAPSIQLLPNPYMQSRWMPMVLLLRIVGTETHFDSSSRVTFDPPGAVMALPKLGDDENILMIGLLMPAWLISTQSIDVTVTTGTEVVSDELNLELPFMMNKQTGQLIDVTH